MARGEGGGWQGIGGEDDGNYIRKSNANGGENGGGDDRKREA